jgi:alcohol oxidase
MGDREAHGDSGPVNISKGTHCCKQAEQSFIDSANEMGYSELKDLQNLDANNATERWLKYIGPNGRRQDAAHRYVHNKLQSGDYPNLHVVCEKQVIRVLFDDNKKAVGVEFQSNPKFRRYPMEIDECARHMITDVHPSAEPRVHDGQADATYSQSQEDGRSLCRC